ncbi:MAG: hypothetical protein HQ523_15755 [Lentisphaerae bacterium]|nr:hypothetical protein [Lentisphaerota bacterium]
MTDWQHELGDFFQQKKATHAELERSELERFITGVAMPAYLELQAELEKHERHVSIRETPTAATLVVQYQGADEFWYCLQGRTLPEGVVPFAEMVVRERKGIRRIRTESMIRQGGDYGVSDITHGEVIGHFLTHYKRSIREE